jgi:AraC-like DNA-binding protein
MRADLDNRMLQGLGRLCVGEKDAGIAVAPSSPGIARIAARIHGQAYAPHRHDTYSLGITLHGVQTFSYRGVSRVSLPGQILVLHPDEVHDGAAGTDAGLVYRMLYLEPALLRDALGSSFSGLPFLSEPVIDDPRFRAALSTPLEDLASPVDDLLRDQFTAATADALTRHAGLPARRAGPVDTRAIERARAFLSENLARPVSSQEIEAVSGLDRFSLARQFRALSGTSPHRYLTMRRLDRARTLIAGGDTLSDVAVSVGFSDQSHLNRQFKKAFGLTPGAWARLCAAKSVR